MVLLAQGPSTAAAEFCSAEPVARLVTSEAADGSTLIPISLTGTAAAATLDTGAPVSVLREGTADQLGLHRVSIPLGAVAGVAGRPFEEGTIVDDVGLGGAIVHNMPFLIAPRTHANDAQSVGLIGADVFARFDLFLDFGGNRIALYHPGACIPTDAASFAAVIVPSKHVYLQVEVDGERAKALLDTGASTSVMTLDTAHRLFGLDDKAPGVRRLGSILSADGGAVAAYGYGFKKLSLGQIDLVAPKILLVPDETRRVHHILTPGQPEGDGLPDLILGMPELRRLQILVAYGANQLLIRPNAAPK